MSKQIYNQLQAKNLAIWSAFEQEIIPGLSLDDQVKDLIQRQTLGTFNRINLKGTAWLTL